jgi:hypothetical protein
MPRPTRSCDRWPSRHRVAFVNRSKSPGEAWRNDNGWRRCGWSRMALRGRDAGISAPDAVAVVGREPDGAIGPGCDRGWVRDVVGRVGKRRDRVCRRDSANPVAEVAREPEGAVRTGGHPLGPLHVVRRVSEVLKMPAVVRRPLWLSLSLVNRRAPSAPVTIPSGPPTFAARSLNVVMSPGAASAGCATPVIHGPASRLPTKVTADRERTGRG